MDALAPILAFLVVLVVLVLVHELGHFVAAKRSGVTVQEFGVGFPPRMASVIWRGTRYSLNWIPLGGFVRMFGEDGEAEVAKLRERGLSEPAIEKVMEGSFSRKTIPTRLVILVAGVAMNMVLGAALFAVAFSQPTPEARAPLVVVAVEPDSPADGALEVDDQIVAVDGERSEQAADLTAAIEAGAGSEVVLTVVREGAEVDVTVVPRTVDQRGPTQGAVGFTWEAGSIAMGPPLASDPINALVLGVGFTFEVASQIPGGLIAAVAGLLGLAPGSPDIAGPIGIASQTGQLLEAPLTTQLKFVALLSVNLAVLNIFPFPPLDGGRVLIVAIEGIRRRKMSAEREALIYLTGFVVLVTLVILISIQDIGRLTGG